MFILSSAGAAVGPLLAGLLSSQGWDKVFYMLMTADFFALLVSLKKAHLICQIVSTNLAVLGTTFGTIANTFVTFCIYLTILILNIFNKISF